MKQKSLLVTAFVLLIASEAFADSTKSFIAKVASEMQLLRKLKTESFRMEFDVFNGKNDECTAPEPNVLLHQSDDVFRVDEPKSKLSITKNCDATWINADGRITKNSDDRIAMAGRIFRLFDASFALGFLKNTDGFAIIDHGSFALKSVSHRAISIIRDQSLDTLHLIIGESDYHLRQAWLSIRVPEVGDCIVRINYEYYDETKTAVAKEIFAEQQNGNGKNFTYVHISRFDLLDRLDDSLFELPAGSTSCK